MFPQPFHPMGLFPLSWTLGMEMAKQLNEDAPCRMISQEDVPTLGAGIG